MVLMLQLLVLLFIMLCLRMSHLRTTLEDLQFRYTVGVQSQFIETFNLRKARVSIGNGTIAVHFKFVSKD